MRFREGTPADLLLEMYFAVLWLPVLLAVIAVTASLLIYRSRYRCRFVALVALLLVALPPIWLGTIYGGLMLLQHPQYRAYVDCDPCF